MKQTLIFWLLVAPNLCFGQLLFKSGRLYDYTKLKFTPHHVEVRTKQGKAKFGIDSLVGYYVLNAGNLDSKYFKSGKKYLNWKLKLAKPEKGLPYAFAGLYSPGKIPIYMRLNYYTAGGPNYSTTRVIENLYLQKDGISYLISAMKKEERMKLLKKLTRDTPELLDSIDLASLSLTNKEIITLIKKYNVLNYQNKVQPSDRKGKITLYRMKAGEAKQPLPIEINDQHFSLEPFDVKAIEVSTENPVKLCLGTGANKHCELITGQEGYIPYYKVSMNKKGKTQLKYEPDKDALNDIRFLQSKKR